MNVSCWACRAVFRVDPRRIPGTGVSARCSRCGSAIALSAFGAAPQGRALTSGDDDWFAEEPGGGPAAPTGRSTSRDDADDWFAEEDAGGRRPAMSRALRESDAAAAPEIEGPVFRAAEARPTGRPVHEPATSSSQVQGRRAELPMRPHPFVRVDPHVRAHRLARALVSDLITYHPGRREIATAAGTLRLAFREEIARSYAVYAAEVGRELAEGTTYFQEALNEMLAQGRALF